MHYRDQLRTWIPAVGLTIALSASALADSPSWREKALETQKAEQLIRAATETQDTGELGKQILVALALGDWTSSRSDRSDMKGCTLAFYSLANYAMLLSLDATAQRYLDRARNLSAFRSHMPLCEAQLGLTAPPPPNLR